MDKNNLSAIAEKKKIGEYGRHFLLCAGPKCIKNEDGQVVWDYLKSQIKNLGLEAKVYRSRVNCLRICSQGAIAVVYPEGSWYRLVNKEAVDKIISSHIIEGRVVEEYLFASNPLSTP